jgi:MATE family multidrug resistance protein
MICLLSFFICLLLQWEILTIFAAALGPAEVATWAILGSIWDIFEASTEGIGDAAEVRCAHHLGKGNPKMAKTSSYKSILFATSLSVVVTAIFFILGPFFPAWFTTDPILQRMLRDLVPLVGIGNVTMTFGMVSWALVGAQGRYALATFVSFVSSWCITIPLSAIFVFGLNVDLQGVTSAVVIGYSCTGTVLSFILLRSDWEHLSDIVQNLNAMTGEVLSDSDDDQSESSLSSSSSSDSDDEDDFLLAVDSAIEIFVDEETAIEILC